MSLSPTDAQVIFSHLTFYINHKLLARRLIILNHEITTFKKIGKRVFDRKFAILSNFR